jgi:hypothetical protein
VIHLREWWILDQGDQIFFNDAFSGETLYILHILQIFCVLFPTSDLTEGTQSRNLVYFLSHVYENHIH